MTMHLAALHAVGDRQSVSQILMTTNTPNSRRWARQFSVLFVLLASLISCASPEEAGEVAAGPEARNVAYLSGEGGFDRVVKQSRAVLKEHGLPLLDVLVGESEARITSRTSTGAPIEVHVERLSSLLCYIEVSIRHLRGGHLASELVSQIRARAAVSG